MWADQRQEGLRKVGWNTGLDVNQPNNTIRVLECWKTDNITEAVENRNFRYTDICREQIQNVQQSDASNAQLDRWLKWQEPFAPLTPPEDMGKPFGGLRIVFCERPRVFCGMTMSQDAFEMIEKTFGLHPTTLPSFCLDAGTYALFDESEGGSRVSQNNIHIVVKVPQKVEIANYMLSLCHDASTGWTNALICGEGVVIDRDGDKFYGSQFTQIVNTICADPQSWNNPFFLPSAILKTNLRRLELRATNISQLLTDVESEIGVTFAGAAGHAHDRPKWPEDIDTKTTVIDLHSVSAQTIFLHLISEWLRNYATFLVASVHQAKTNKALQARNVDFHRTVQAVEYLQNSSGCLRGRFLTFKERATLQINVLFNILGVRASIVGQRDTQLNFHIAKSSKQDSISAGAFTFITAIFLPGSFVGTIFGISMFRWQLAYQVAGKAPPTVPYVANTFWIFWVVTVPLTIATIMAWYWWSRSASKKWVEELNSARNVVAQPYKPVHSPHQHVFTGKNPYVGADYQHFGSLSTPDSRSSQATRV